VVEAGSSYGVDLLAAKAVGKNAWSPARVNSAGRSRRRRIRASFVVSSAGEVGVKNRYCGACAPPAMQAVLAADKQAAALRAGQQGETGV
jgi:hypothetical protein